MKIEPTKERGQAATMIIVTALVMQGANWTGDYFLKSPERSDQRITILDTKINRQAQILSTLCNDYGQTISRVDQNVQNIGTSLRVPVVLGKVDSNPCDESKLLTRAVEGNNAILNQ